MRADITLNGTGRSIEGPLLTLRRNVDIGLNEAVDVIGQDGTSRLGRVVALDDDSMVVEVLESTAGLALADMRLRVRGEPLTFPIGPDILGRVLDGIGRPVDGGPPIAAVENPRIDGEVLNPARRALPTDFIETGVTAIDLMNSLVRGQKLPIFSGGGLPHDRLAMEIATQARLRSDAGESFSIIFAGIGISYDTAANFRHVMEETGALAHTVMFLNMANDPSAQRILTPRYALTAAEYLAFGLGHHVLVVMTDITNYCEALREVSAGHGEIPSRKGYPGYLYSDLATLYERAGWMTGSSGTVTQVPILTMPSDDISHPVPDLTGYITEGQIVLDRVLDRKGIYPPINVLPSLSRLIDQGIGAGFTDADHPALAQQLFATYSKAVRTRVLASVVGRDGLTEIDRQHLDFADRFETDLVHQDGRRDLEDSMETAWALLRTLPGSELMRLSDAQIERHLMGDIPEPEPQDD
ncbi:V-type ATP synthase subunit B [Rhodovulum sp. P5]|uniref:V-type ATP synthase subunit B n=1 Tax=Rhodovulum sp. P5 TaxID=1564506 RepID=UPI0009C26ECF|nr:V-type ATP synthase subunit B [Rhodovulum sp. P5]ARE40989.1 V-type ATP synthase subunit B [Rhodovulum sp. P5]